MPITTKQKPRSKKATRKASAKPDLGTQVDSLGEKLKEAKVLEDLAHEKGKEERERANEIRAEASDLEKKIREAAGRDLGVTESAEIVGKLYVGKLGKEKEFQTVTDPLGAFVKLTDAEAVEGETDETTEYVISAENLEAFLKAVKLPLGVLQDYIAKKELEAFVKKEAIGPQSRQFKVEPRK